MSEERTSLPRLRHSLSARLLLLTIGFVMLAEVMIYTPSIARFRRDYLAERLVDAHIATLALEATPTHMVSPELETQLLTVVGAYSVVRIVQGQTRMLIMNREMPPSIDASYDLRNPSWLGLVADAFVTLAQPKNRILRVLGPDGPGMTEELVLDETPLRRAMYDYSVRILSVSIMISLVTAGLVYWALQMLLVRPLRQVAASMHAFGEAPDDVGTLIQPSRRRDEIGMVQRELARLQTELRASLREKTRLAALGAAMIRINHDLRNILATAQLVSDRLGHLEDATVRRLTPPLIAAIDRAIALCVNTITFAREDTPAPRPERFPLRPLVEEVGAALAPMAAEESRWLVEMPDGLMVHADRDQMFRVLVNLGRNAYEAGATAVQLAAQAGEGGVEIEIADNGRGLTPAARQRLFQAFAGSGKAGGSGLGLAIVRDVLRAHGGDIELASSRPGETRFRLRLPDRRVAAA